MQVVTTDCQSLDNPCLEGVVKVINLMCIHEYGTETNPFGCSFWPWGKSGLLNQSMCAGGREQKGY